MCVSVSPLALSLVPYPKEFPCQLELDVDEDDVVCWMLIAPLTNFVEARREAVARRQRVYYGDVVHEPSAGRVD